MTQVDSTKLISYCTDISNNVRNAFPHIDLHFLIYQDGEKADKISRLLPHLKSHPAYDEAVSLLKFTTINKDHSGFIGIAEGTEKLYLNIKKPKKKYLAFITLNTSQYTKFEDLTFSANYSCSQLIEAISGIKSNKEEKTDPAEANSSYKKNKTKSLLTNLNADIYSTLQMVREKHYNAATSLALKRSIETLTPQSEKTPETHAFPIALHTVIHTIDNQIFSSVIARNKHPIISQFHLSSQISSCFEKEDFETWRDFATYSQMMAWEGFTASQILGAAIYTSTNPFIKSMGNLLAEITNLSPVTTDYLPNGYNPFVDNQINQINHNRLIDDIFEMSLIHSIEAESHIPLMHMANNQNESLLKGKISGWCANSLHAAARSYANAEDRGVPPTQAARLEFQSERLESNWDILIHLHHHIIGLLRAHQSVAFTDILDWLNNKPETDFLRDSILITLEGKDSLEIQKGTALFI